MAASFDLTVTLPESWAGRYEYRAYEGKTSGVAFYCTAACAGKADAGDPQGRLFWIDVVPGFLAPDTVLANNCRVLAATPEWSILLMYPSELAFTEEGQRECRAMYEDIGLVRVELSDALRARSLNESNWNRDAVTLFAMDEEADGWSAPVVCDGSLSSALGQMLEGRELSGTTHRAGNVCAVYRGTAYRIATGTEEDSALLHLALESLAAGQ